MSKFYAVYQAGHAVYGVGNSVTDAINDAREWVDNGDNLESDIVDRHQANVGDMVVAECSEALFNKVKEIGGEVEFTEHTDIVRLYSEIE